MPTFKLGKNIKIEGNPTEIHDIVANTGLIKSEFFISKSDPKIHWMWVALSNFSFFIVICLLYLDVFDVLINKILAISSFFTLCGALVTIQLRCKSNVISGICALFGVVLLLIGLHVLSPGEAAKVLQNKIAKPEQRK